jgi:L-asparagine transporter-like permease
MLAALFMDKWFHETAYVYMLGSAFFGGLFVWMMIFITHIIFRRRAPVGALRFAPPGPWSSLMGLAALTAVLISTWWVPGLRITLQAGIPWLAFITLCYFAWTRRRASGAENPKNSEQS